MSTPPPVLGAPAPALGAAASTSRGPRAFAPGALLLTRAGLIWGETWRVLVALVIGLVALGATVLQVETGNVEVRMAAYPWLDLLLGLVSLGLLLLRRRAPLAVALVLAGLALVAATPVGAAVIAAASLATHRQPHQIAILAALFLPSNIVYSSFYRRTTPLLPDGSGRAMVPDWVFDVGGAVICYAIAVSVGAFIGTRRDLVRSLRDQAAASEQEHARRAEQARAAERERIAREMHDALAHRMSLVAMHAGALTYRIDLSPDQVRETAAIIHDGTHQALEELRAVLGMLRGSGSAVNGVPIGARPESPQPTLDDLDELIGQARSAGSPVRVEVELTEGAAPPTATSRNAYRLVQEALTNARKHAPGGRVLVEIRGGPGEGLAIRTSNPVFAPTHDVTGTSVSRMPGAGMGLIGMTERAQVVGGTLEYGECSGHFEVRGWLPWPA